MKKYILTAIIFGASAVSGTTDAQFYVVKNGEVKKTLDYTPDYITFQKPSPSDADAQFYIVKDDEVKEALDYTPDYVTFENPMLCGGIIGDAVDMGLSVKWSSVNVGAFAPEDYGNYYAWGETTTKTDYSWENYKHMQNGKSTWRYINKYQAPDGQYRPAWYNADNEFTGDGKGTLEKEDDAAAVKWGGDWVMPTKADFEELYNKCYWVWTDNYNSTNTAGFIIYKAKADEDKGQHVPASGTPSTSYSLTDVHIFMPAAGCRDGSDLYREGTYGYYWSDAVDEYGSNAGCGIYFYSDYLSPWYSENRRLGFSVRPVCPPLGETSGHATVDLGLPSGKLWGTCNVGASAPQNAGDFFAWGETAAKTDYTWATYSHVREGGTQWQDVNKYTVNDGNIEGVIWYNDNGEFIGDNKTTLEAADDAATANWGDKWRMPTGAEWEELYNNTTHQWTNNYNGKGVAGWILTSTVTGHTNESIFLPAAGYNNNENVVSYYWLASLNKSNSDFSRVIEFSSYNIYPLNINLGRCYGQAVRPVCPAE